MKKQNLLTAMLLGFISIGLHAQGVSLDFLQEKAKKNNPQAALLPLIQQATDLQIRQLQVYQMLKSRHRPMTSTRLHWIFNSRFGMEVLRAIKRKLQQHKDW
jgi:hypothetical protein